jgi:hypothetical protein
VTDRAPADSQILELAAMDDSALRGRELRQRRLSTSLDVQIAENCRRQEQLSPIRRLSPRYAKSSSRTDEFSAICMV